MCGLDLSTWTLPDAEAHADGCLDLVPPVDVDAATGTEERGAREVGVPSSGCPPARRRGPSPATCSWTEEAELRGDAGDAAASTARGAPPPGTRVGPGDGMTDAERHDDDWLRLAVAMSASLADAENARVMATSGDYGWLPAPSVEGGSSRGGLEEDRGRGRLVEPRVSTKPPDDADATLTRAMPTGTGATPLADSTNSMADEGRGARDGADAVEMPKADAVEMPKAIRFAIRAGRRRRGGDDDDYEGNDGNDGDELDAGLDATQRTRRRIRAPLWSMAGHGGRDEPLPDSLLARCLGK